MNENFGKAFSKYENKHIFIENLFINHKPMYNRFHIPRSRPLDLNMSVVKPSKSGIAVGINKGHIVTPRAFPAKKTPQVS